MAFALVVVPLLIRLVGLEEYGLWTLASAAIGLVGLAEAGLSVSTTVFVSQDLANHDDTGVSETLTVTMGAILLMATLAALVLWLGASTLVELFPTLDQSQQPVAIRAFQIGAAVVWIQLVQRIFVSMEQARQRYDVVNLLSVMQIIAINLGLVVVAATGGRTVELIVWQASASAGMLVIHGLVTWYLFHHIKLRPTWNPNRAYAVARYSVLTWAVSLSSALFSQADRLIVGAMLGVGPLGLYAAITNIVSKISTASAASVQPLLPALSALTAPESIPPPSLQRHVRQASQFNALVALGMGGVFLVLASVAMRVILPDTVTAEQIVLFRLAAVIYALYSLNAVGYYALLGMKAAGTCMIIQLTSAGLALLLIANGSASWGLAGAIVGNAGYLLTWSLVFFGMRRLEIPVHLWFTWSKFPFAWFLVMALLSVILPDQMVLQIAITAVAVGILCVWFAIAQQDRVYPLFQRLVARR
ncbi:MAG: lipopolysaccharide biosynthesis protein [Chloroflexi bacterium]|nr:lipopolysaccharide biosynthesis protein [Chloroflexota bacterium]MBU1750211.1 lipopolysaccharide biosynthesis protein [Chloroflexota bacterium]